MPTVVTKTIGPTGRDYTTFTLAEAAVESIATAEFGSTDLVANDGAIVFEADAGTYSESVTFSSSLTTDATRQVTYKPAAGSEHGGVRGAGVVLTGDGAAVRTVRLEDPFLIVEGFNLTSSTTYCAWLRGDGSTIKNCIASATDRGIIVYGGTAANPIQVLNCVVFGGTGFSFYNFAGGAFDTHAKYVNCTGFASTGTTYYNQSSGSAAYAEYVNCLSLDTLTYSEGGSPVSTGSGNFGGATNPFPVALQGSPYPITASTSFSTPLGSGDYAVYMGATGALANVTGNDVWQQGVGPGTNSDVPTTDINGVARSGASCNPGAFEADGFVAPTITTQTIGPVGRDYATFILAEASLPAEDITFTNRAFVFEADAATYNEIITFQSSLTTDATRQVTYKPATGSEHGGDKDAGVIIDGASTTPVNLRDSYMALRGLNIKSQVTAVYLALPTTGRVLEGLIIGPSTTTGGYTQVREGADQTVFRNCVFRDTGAWGVNFNPATVNGSNSCAFLNCTFFASTSAIIDQPSVAASVTLLNNLFLTGSIAYSEHANTTSTGSNNYAAGALSPVALQGSPYPITPTTNTTPGFGDYAIYEAATGALIVVDDNAALGGGVGPAANADVPVFDINGVKRIGGGCDPGAFEGVRSRSTDVWDVVTATHTTPGTFGELLQQIKIAATSAASSRTN